MIATTTAGRLPLYFSVLGACGLAGFLLGGVVGVVYGVEEQRNRR